jgi:hypothetical protein
LPLIRHAPPRRFLRWRRRIFADYARFAAVSAISHFHAATLRYAITLPPPAFAATPLTPRHCRRHYFHFSPIFSDAAAMPPISLIRLVFAAGFTPFAATPRCRRFSFLQRHAIDAAI